MAIGNGYNGVEIGWGAKNNRIGTDGNGGADAAERNIISGNAAAGVLVQGAGAGGSLIAGNFIGTDLTGAGPLGNSGDGLRISAESQSNQVGGSALPGPSAGEHRQSSME